MARTHAAVKIEPQEVRLAVAPAHLHVVPAPPVVDDFDHESAAEPDAGSSATLSPEASAAENHDAAWEPMYYI